MDIPARRHLYALRGRGRRVSRLWALCQTSGVLFVYLPAAARRRVNGLSRSQPQSTPFSLILPASPTLSFLRLFMPCPRTPSIPRLAPHVARPRPHQRSADCNGQRGTPTTRTHTPCPRPAFPTSPAGV
ncbi:hypothetical protein B0H10DRAFT_2092648 [Mycena sp. CBHHK59/15]|nr:hypothetical protein B0H10DRAFT_2134411 [Mycena sp. CBHHK59/15]KAJ6590341.1 hypothetical protein B0H10DRAFT_2092648 [Mycena sp. CBHHK59/15]